MRFSRTGLLRSLLSLALVFAIIYPMPARSATGGPQTATVAGRVVDQQNALPIQNATVDLVSKSDLAKLRANPSHQIMLVDFWATWCGSCIAEFANLQDTFRMYSDRDLSLVTVSVNMPDEQASAASAPSSAASVRSSVVRLGCPPRAYANPSIAPLWMATWRLVDMP